MDRNWIVNPCLNSETVQVLLQFVAVARANNIEMKDVFAARIERRHDEVFPETIRIHGSVSTTRRIPIVEVSQLYVEDCSLDCIKPRVGAFLDVHVLLLLPVVAQAVESLRK